MENNQDQNKETKVSYIEDENKKTECWFTIGVLIFGVISFLSIIIMGIVSIVKKNNIGMSIGQVIVGSVLTATFSIGLIVTIKNLRDLKKQEGCKNDRILEDRTTKRGV